jgi:hypothetical protein
MEVYVNCSVAEIPDIICYGNKTPLSRSCNVDLGFRNLESEADLPMQDMNVAFLLGFTVVILHQFSLLSSL